MAFDPVLAEVGARIVKRRKELHMTASELSIQAGVSGNTLSLYETGQRAMGIDKMYRIAQALMIPFSYLQPDELPAYSMVPEGFSEMLEKLYNLPADKRSMLLKMFQAQIAVVE